MEKQKIHQQLSAECFNEVWKLLDKDGRTADESRLMREMAHASLFHWLKRDDCEAQQISIGLWQISRVYSVLRDGRSAMTYALECITVSNEAALSNFYRGYAYEAASRAAGLLKDSDAAAQYFEEALKCLEGVEGDDAAYLKADLDELEVGASKKD